MTTIDCLYITDLCENKIAASDDVQKEMHRLEGQLSLSVIPIYEKSQFSQKVCFLNARSLHKHLSDVLSFVSARVGKIQTNTDPSQWRHIPGEVNVTDDVSRRIRVEELN